MKVLYKCVEKVFGPGKRILAYVIIDELNNEYRFTPEELRDILKNDKMEIVNLKLSKSDSIIDKYYIESGMFSIGDAIQLNKSIMVEIENKVNLYNKTVQFMTVNNLENFIFKCELRHRKVIKVIGNIYVVCTDDNNISIFTDKKFELSGKNAEYLFYESKAKEVNLSNIIMDRATSLNSMFALSNITNVLFGNAKLTYVESMVSMFEGCKYINEIDFSGRNLQSLKYLDRAFKDCAASKIDMSNTYTLGLLSMDYTFAGCKDLKTVNLMNFAAYEVKCMSHTFDGCMSLRELNLSSFTTLSLTDTSAMFSDCTMLHSVNLSNFDTKKVSNFNEMFQNCSNLIELNIEHFNFDSLNNKTPIRMFKNCLKLRGYLESSRNVMLNRLSEQTLRAMA